MSHSTPKSKNKPLYSAKKSPRLYIDPSDFYLMRRRAYLTTEQAAKELDVTHRTILNWEKGRSPIPYAAFKVLRMKAGYVLTGKHWDEWFVRDDTLWSPEGRGFKPHELRYIANYFWMARQWLAERQGAKSQVKPPVTQPLASGKASEPSPLDSAAALLALLGSFDTEPCHEMPQHSHGRPSLQEKPKGFDAFLAKLLEFEV